MESTCSDNKRDHQAHHALSPKHIKGQENDKRSLPPLPVTVVANTPKDDELTPRRTRLRFVLIWICVTVFSIWFLGLLRTPTIQFFIYRYLEWMHEHRSMGTAMLIVACVLARFAFVPLSVLSIGTGFGLGAAFGFGTSIILGSIAVIFGTFCGSMGTFFLSRYFLRDILLSWMSQWSLFQALDRALESRGLQILFIVRLSPLVPHNALDYLCGVTSLSFTTFVLALVAMIPGTIAYVIIGVSASHLTRMSSVSDEGTPSSETSGGNYYGMTALDDDGNLGTQEQIESLRAYIVVGGLVFAFAGLVLASYFSKLELDRILQADKEAKGPDSPHHEESPLLPLSSTSEDSSTTTESAMTAGETNGFHDEEEQPMQPPYPAALA